MGYSRKNPNRVAGWGHGVSSASAGSGVTPENSMWRACRIGNSRGQVKKKVSGISRSDHEQAILVFGVGISIRCSTILWNFWEKLCFPQNFLGLSDKSRNSRRFTKELYLQHNPLEYPITRIQVWTTKKQKSYGWYYLQVIHQ